MLLINSQLELLKSGQQTSNAAIQNVSEHMSSIQSITSSIKEQDKRVTLVEDRTNRMEAQMHAIVNRMDAIEQNSTTISSTIQINGVPNGPEENLRKIILDIAALISTEIKSVDVAHVNRNKPHVQRSTSTRSATVTDPTDLAASSTHHQLSMFPILVTFTNEQIKNQFLGFFRKKRFLFIDDIGFVSPTEEEKNRIFIFEHLIPSLKKLYTKTKSFQKANKFKYLWTKNGNIFLRKGDDTKIIRVFEHTDLSKLAKKSNAKPNSNEGSK